MCFSYSLSAVPSHETQSNRESVFSFSAFLLYIYINKYIYIYIYISLYIYIYIYINIYLIYYIYIFQPMAYFKINVIRNVSQLP